MQGSQDVWIRHGGTVCENAQIVARFGDERDLTAIRRMLRRRALLLDALFILLLGALGLATLIGAGSGRVRDVLGISAYTVTTGSMQREIPVHSLVVVRRVEPDTLRVGDTVTYRAGSAFVTHKIIALPGDGTVITQGVENNAPDRPVPVDTLVGKVIWHNHALGATILFIRANAIPMIVMAGLLIALCAAVRRVLT